MRIKAGHFADIDPQNRELMSIVSTALTQSRWLDSRAIKKDLGEGAFDFSEMKTRPLHADQRFRQSHRVIDEVVAVHPQCGEPRI